MIFTIYVIINSYIVTNNEPKITFILGGNSMLFHKNKINADVVKDIDVSSYHWCSSAKLVMVSGTGALETETTMETGDYYGHRFLSHIKLNGVPLVQKDSPSCPTCASMLATGYGINTVDCPEIRNISDKLNR